MSSTIHILQRGESRGKEKTFQKRPFIFTPQTETFRTLYLQVSDLQLWMKTMVNQNTQSRRPRKTLWQHVKIIHHCRFMLLQKSCLVPRITELQGFEGTSRDHWVQLKQEILRSERTRGALCGIFSLHGIWKQSSRKQSKKEVTQAMQDIKDLYDSLE